MATRLSAGPRHRPKSLGTCYQQRPSLTHPIPIASEEYWHLSHATSQLLDRVHDTSRPSIGGDQDEGKSVLTTLYTSPGILSGLICISSEVRRRDVRIMQGIRLSYTLLVEVRPMLRNIKYSVRITNPYAQPLRSENISSRAKRVISFERILPSLGTIWLEPTTTV